MKKILFCLVIIPFLSFSQVQIGTDIDGEAEVDESGYAVSLSSDGSIMAIGAINNDANGNISGHVRIYQYNGTDWTQIGTDIDGEAAFDGSGNAVSLSSDGSIVAIGARNNDGNGANSGHVRIYQFDGTDWTQLGGDIDGEASLDQSGFAVSLSSNGSIVAIGAGGNDGNGSNAGHVRIYQYDGTNWTQLGLDIDGEASNDSSGRSVSLSSNGSIVAIGAIGGDGNGSDSGHVRIYQYNGTDWAQIGTDIDGEAVGDLSGSAVSLSGDGSIVAIGAYRNDANGINSGHVRIYQFDGSDWTQIGTDIDGEAEADESGRGAAVSLSSDGSIVAIGAHRNDANGNNSGHVRIYQFDNSVWTQIGTDIDGEAADDVSGFSVSLSSDSATVAIGAIGNDGNGSNSGHVRVFDLSGITLSIESFKQASVSIYPNPTSLILTIALPNTSELKKVTIYNNLGQLILEDSKTKIDVSNYSKGIYFAEIMTTKGNVTKKFIVE